GFFLCILVAALYILKAKKIYRAVAIIQIDRENEGVFGTKELYISSGREQDYLQTQYKNLQSPTLLRRVIAELELEKLPQYQKSLDVVDHVRRQMQLAP